MTDPFKVMALAGSSAKIDLCTGGAFEYKDASVRFPMAPVLAWVVIFPQYSISTVFKVFIGYEYISFHFENIYNEVVLNISRG